MRVAVLINPVSGADGHSQAGFSRAATASRVLAAAGAETWIRVTEQAGHAHELTRAALAAGADVVAAWGGDGTVNEVASVLASGRVPLGIIPNGSGNGLALELGLPMRAEAALAILTTGRDRIIDAGELDGRLFFNVAGIGLDARIAARFGEGHRRGLTRYVQVTLRELFTWEPLRCTVSTDAGSHTIDAMMVAFANSRQYGNGLLIAPEASLDDGLLDVVAVGARAPLTALWQLPWVFSGRAGGVQGVRMEKTPTVRIVAASRLECHVDGEAFLAGTTVEARVHPAALKVRVPG
jgi:YegS/Rv2252/BmrU family lipid kinase